MFDLEDGDVSIGTGDSHSIAMIKVMIIQKNNERDSNFLMNVVLRFLFFCFVNVEQYSLILQFYRFVSFSVTASVHNIKKRLFAVQRYITCHVLKQV